MNGKQVRLYLVDGTSGGLITAEIMNWTGHVIMAPRSELARLAQRAEVSRTGIYLLLGEDPDRPGDQVDGEFIVRAESRARRDWVGTSRGYIKLRQQLEADGTLELADDSTAMIFTKDCVFASPSAAAAVLLGRAANGRTSWKVVSTGASYDHWQTSLLDTEAADEQ